MVDIIITCLASNACSYQSIQRIDFFMSVQNLPLVGNSFVVASLLVLEKFFFLLILNSISYFTNVCVGPKDWASPARFISNPRPTPRKRKHPKMNNEGPRLLWGFAKDHPVLDKPGSLKEKAGHPQRQPFLSSQRKGPTQGDSYEGMVEEQF